jgi:hypothetical protein
VVVAVLVAFAGIGMSVAGALTTGISSDEPTHVRRLNSYVTNGMYALDSEILKANGGMPDRAYVYAPVTGLLMNQANRVAGNDIKDHVSRTSEAYAVRHVVITAIAALGVLGAAAIAWLLLGNWRWGVVAAAALSAVPMWTGHAMFNPKDVSVATGYTWVTLGLILLARAPGKAALRPLLVAGGIITVGTILMLGTRPGMWIGLALSVGVMLGALALTEKYERSIGVTLAGSAVVAYGVLLVTYPMVYANPAKMLWKSAVVSSDFQHRGTTISRNYVIVHTVTEWPFLLLLLLGVGAAAAAMSVRRRWRTRPMVSIALLLVGTQAFALTAIAIIRNSNLYNGLRQLLFAVPAEAALATLGMAVLLARTHQTWKRVALTSALALGLLLPMAAQAAMFPYQYAYQNVVAQAFGGEPDADYWDTSFREFAPVVSADVKLVCPHWGDREHLRRSRADCRTKAGGPFSAYWEDRRQPAFDNPRSNEFNVLLRGTVDPPRRCSTTAEITRELNLRPVVISRLLQCQSRAPQHQRKAPRVVDPWDPRWKG